MTIDISNEAVDAILKINERYFFDLFKDISVSEEEEYRFRDAVAEIAETIKNELNK